MAALAAAVDVPARNGEPVGALDAEEGVLGRAAGGKMAFAAGASAASAGCCAGDPSGAAIVVPGAGDATGDLGEDWLAEAACGGRGVDAGVVVVTDAARGVTGRAGGNTAPVSQMTANQRAIPKRIASTR